MSDFVWVESPGATLELVPAVISSTLGDGYVQDAPAGLNAVKQVWDVPFNNVDVAVADDIQAFLGPGLGWARFSWVPPQQSTALRFKCTSYRRSLTDKIGEHNINVRFEQVFEA